MTRLSKSQVEQRDTIWNDADCCRYRPSQAAKGPYESMAKSSQINKPFVAVAGLRDESILREFELGKLAAHRANPCVDFNRVAVHRNHGQVDREAEMHIPFSRLPPSRLLFALVLRLRCEPFDDAIDLLLPKPSPTRQPDGAVRDKRGSDARKCHDP